MTEKTAKHLASLSGYSIPVRVSPGAEGRARVIADRADRALTWLQQLTGRHPRFTLYVVGQQDWPAVAEVPIYAMPQAFPGKVVTSPEPASWWDEYLDAIRPYLSADQLADVMQAYGDPTDFTTVADLVAVHEITHLFHEIDPVTWASEFPADWLTELFANLGMYGYVAENEPEHLVLLTTLTNAARAAASAPWPFRDRAAMGQSMQVSVANYVWYEFMLIGFAESIWNTGGKEAMLAYQRTLGDPQLSPEQVLIRLQAIDPAVSAAVARWPEA